MPRYALTAAVLLAALGPGDCDGTYLPIYTQQGWCILDPTEPNDAEPANPRPGSSDPGPAVLPEPEPQPEVSDPPSSPRYEPVPGQLTERIML